MAAPRLPRRKARARRPSDSRAPRSTPYAVESLEIRRLLAGVTIVTHGLGENPFTTPDWLIDTARDLAVRTDATFYTMTMIPNGFGGAIVQDFHQVIARSGGDVVMYVNWANASEYTVTPQIEGGDIADLILPYLTSPIDGKVLGQLPIHLIGHSRGASVMSALSLQLARQGIWVEELTYLDPHPLTMGDPQPLFPVLTLDPGVNVYDNVVYADNYRQTNGGFLGLAPTGQHVPGTHELDLTDVSGMDHRRVHSYYYGTINLYPTAHEEVDVEESWYSQSGLGPRSAVGFNQSHWAGGSWNPDGIGALAGGNATRTHAPVTSATPYSNIGSLTARLVPTGGAGGAGDSIGSTPSAATPATFDLNYRYQDLPGGASVVFYLDDDTDPYNGGVQTLGSETALVATGDTPLSDARSLQLSARTDTLAQGVYHVYARITNQYGKTRFAYADKSFYRLPDGSMAMIDKTSSTWGTTRWSDARNWTPTGVPQDGDFVLVTEDLTLDHTAHAGTLFIASGNVTWKSGDLAASVYVASGGTLTVAEGGYKSMASAHLVNAGSVVWDTDTGVTTDGASLIDNLAGATFTMMRDTPSSVPLARVNNYGTFVKVADTTAVFSAPFHNSGLLRSAGGELEITQRLYNGGAVEAAGGKLTLSAGTEGSGTYTAANGLIAIGGGADFPAGTVLQGDGYYEFRWGNVTGDFTIGQYARVMWTGGDLLAAHVRLEQTAELHFRGWSTLYMPRTVIDNNGLIEWDGTYNYVVANAATINNLASGRVRIHNRADLAWDDRDLYPPVLNNQGLVRVEVPNSSFFLVGYVNNATGGVFELDGGDVDARLKFSNHGTVKVFGRSQMAMQYDGDHDGTFYADPDARIDFGGTTTFGPYNGFTGAGKYFCAGDATMTDTGINSRNWVQYGNLAGSFGLSGYMTWVVGTISASFTVYPGSLLTVGDPLQYGETTLKNAAVTNGSTIRITPRHTLVADGATVNNLQGAVIEMRGDAAVSTNYWGGPSVLNNAGHLEKGPDPDVPETSDAHLGFTTINNSGSIHAISGVLQVHAALHNDLYLRAWAGATIVLTNGADGAGSFAADAGGTIQYSYGDFHFLPATTFAGEGAHLITANCYGVMNLGRLTRWASGANYATVSVPEGGVLELYGQSEQRYFAGAALTNNGTIRWTGSGKLALGPNSALVNNSLFEATGGDDALLDGSPYGTAGGVTNNGTLRKTGPAGTFTVSAPLAKTGRLEVLGGGMNFGGAGFTLSDTLYVAAGATFRAWSPATVNAATIFAGGPVTFADDATFKGRTTVTGVGPLVLEDWADFPAGGSVDLHVASLIWRWGRSDIDTYLTDLLAASYNRGRWDGPAGAFASWDAANDVRRCTAYGVALASALGYTKFAGQDVYGATALARYTWYGDASLDGRVSADDVAVMLTQRAQGKTGWSAGDFNYDRKITADDWSLFSLGAAYSKGKPIDAGWNTGAPATIAASLPTPASPQHPLIDTLQSEADLLA